MSTLSTPIGQSTGPDTRGRYGEFGGRYVPETLIPALERLENAFRDALEDAEFLADVENELTTFVGRPTPLTPAPRLSKAWGANILLKREDLAHTGAHKINNAVGQAMLAKRLGAQRVIAETGAGQHGVATAAACARLGLPCRVYQGSLDVQRQAPNAQRMKLFGAELVPVDLAGRPGTLRAAIDETIRDWVHDPEETYYLIGSVVGPHPYPWIVETMQSVIGREAREQCLADFARLPDAVIACVGGGSNAAGTFAGFLDDDSTALIGIEAGGNGGTQPGDHAASLSHGTPGILHGAYAPLLQDGDGQVIETHSISAGLDYPGVGPRHGALMASGRARYAIATDAEALEALHQACALEGVLPALETAHALAGARRYASEHPGETVLVTCSGRGDKDLEILAAQAGSAEEGR